MREGKRPKTCLWLRHIAFDRLLYLQLTTVER